MIGVSVRRVCVHTERESGPLVVDLALPSDVPVGELLPPIVDMLDDRCGSPPAGEGWRLDRLAGGELAEWLSLSDNGIRDGELLVLAHAETPALGPMTVEPCRDVAASEPTGWDATRFLSDGSCVVASVVAALALVWTGVSGDPMAATIVAALSACAAAAMAWARPRSSGLSLATVVLAAATGYLVVPSGPSAANVFLAAAASTSASLVMLRLTRRVSSTIVAAASLSALVTVATVLSMPIAAVGAALSTASLGLLALSPRITVAMAGLGPDQWTGGVMGRATTAHATLTGLVAGCAVGIAAGATLVASAGITDPANSDGCAVFTGVLALVSLLRARTYVDSPRRVALVGGGLASGIASVGAGVAGHPASSSWVSGAVVAAGVIAAVRPPAGAAVSRMVDRAEYAALVAVVPLACLVSGAYDVVRGVELP